ncbi:MAG: hypothetical protein MUC53_09340 [Candidatus Contendobacter sp.]|nr:hypothetical protein [Candidatus Contendobacter sp.]
MQLHKTETNLTVTNVQHQKGRLIMTVLDSLQRPDSAVLTLRTLTPLYTGGVGQHGDQIHPSGLLGSLRKFSGLLAAAVGDPDFEHAVWGTAPNADDRHAKQITLRVDATGLKKTTLPYQINWPRSDGVNRKGWFYNVAYEGVLSLTLTRRGISDAHWQLLSLALRIQLRHATFGARDQWGLGVLTSDELPAVSPLLSSQAAPLADCPGLHRALFAEIQFDAALPQGMESRLKQGLIWREYLRGSFRNPGEDDLRHYLFGKLGQYGGALNLSALYPHGKGCALRVWGVLPHTTPPRFAEQRQSILQRLQHACHQGPSEGLAGARRLLWQDGAEHQQDFANWINQRAGVRA